MISTLRCAHFGALLHKQAQSLYATPYLSTVLVEQMDFVENAQIGGE